MAKARGKGRVKLTAKPAELAKSTRKKKEKPPEAVVASLATPDSIIAQKVKVRSIVDESVRYGAIRLHLVKGKTVMVHKELAAFLQGSNRCV